MLHVLGSRKTLCDGITRRDLLHAGGLGLFGLGMSDLLRLRELQASPAQPSLRFGQAKSCILLFLFGSPAQHETFDPKPEAPAEIQGELKAIPTNVSGVHIGEGLPQVARVMDRLTLVRSMTHSLPFHAVHYAVSGIPSISNTVEAVPNDRTLWPCLGSAIDYLEHQRNPKGTPAIPRNIGLPFPLYSKANFPLLGGPYAGFLGAKYDPVWTDFLDKGTKAVPNLMGKSGVFDPYGGIKPDSKFSLGGLAGSPTDMTLQRFDRRRSLLNQFDDARRWLETHRRVRNYNHSQSLAYSLLSSSKMGEALEVDREPTKVRERYGMTLFGQSSLAARRLVEAGGKFVTVFWDAYDNAGGGWDTHTYHYQRLKQLLLPGFDAAYSALILDLEARGTLDETLVICISEHGRTPKLSANVKGGSGRDHWSRAYSAVFAGGGMARGKVVGETDSIAGDVKNRPISPKDVLATSLHLLGIDPATTVPDQFNQPHPIAGDGKLQTELLA